MADKCESSGSVHLGSDQVFDRNCSVCEPRNKIKEATACCRTCLEYFCNECLEFHNSLPVLRDHKIQELGDTKGQGTLKNERVKQNTITTMCQEHSGRPAEMFCQQHHVVCCCVCAIEKHRLCENVGFIPKLSRGFSKKPGLSNFKLNLQQLKADLSRLRSSRQTDQLRIKQESNQALEKIKAYRERINAIFDNLERSVIDEAQQKYEHYRDRTQADLDECDEAIRNIEESTKSLDAVDKRNEAQLFVNVKKARETVSKCRSLCQQIENRVGGEKISFVNDARIEECLTNIEKLGDFVELHKLKKRQNVNVKTDDSDSSTCNIHGSCCLPPDETLITDLNNNKLKRLDFEYTVTDSCRIPDPYGVCYIPDTQEAAVGQLHGPIHIVSTKGKLAILRSIKQGVDNSCYGLAYNEGQIYVGEFRGKVVRIYDYTSGLYKSTLQTAPSGQNIFGKFVRHMATSRNGSNIWVSDMTKGLIQLDRRGRLLRTIKHAELDGVAGVCLDEQNNVIACGHWSRNVVQIRSDDGAMMGVLINPEDLPAEPQSVCFDKVRSRLVVTMSNCDNIIVFHLK